MATDDAALISRSLAFPTELLDLLMITRVTIDWFGVCQRSRSFKVNVK